MRRRQHRAAVLIDRLVHHCQLGRFAATAIATSRPATAEFERLQRQLLHSADEDVNASAIGRARSTSFVPSVAHLCAAHTRTSWEAELSLEPDIPKASEVLLLLR